MRRSPAACVTEGQASRLGARLRNDMGKGLERRVRAHQENVRRGRQPRNRREIPERVVRQFRVEKRIGGVTARNHDQRVAVGRGGNEGLGSNHAAGAWPVFDNDRLTPFLRDRVPQGARENIDPAAGGVGYEDVHRSRWKRRLRGCSAYRRQQEADAKRYLQTSAAAASLPLAGKAIAFGSLALSFPSPLWGGKAEAQRRPGWGFQESTINVGLFRNVGTPTRPSLRDGHPPRCSLRSRGRDKRRSC